jgi:hypothetical protein
VCENLNLIENVELKLNETRWMAIYVETRVSGRSGGDARRARRQGRVGRRECKRGEGEAG